ncbi:glucose-1-phosphate thymidylyltransferase RfbA [Prochlorococcus sp. MIT 0916]|uniref:glucose-1-phosphate thymidylyltransferase RfbA n=1 Tax=Prochlorococcus sp. MIT 0916 TaxID=3082521 RepID=UPI0039B66674
MNYSSLRKGILLAGGKGTRLAPLTSAFSKQLMPVYDKPMIYYSITTLMLCGIKKILIISDPENIDLYFRLLGNGDKWGIELSYAIQENPEGVAQSVLIGEEFIDSSHIAIALGDNIFHGNEFIPLLRSADTLKKGSTVFAYPVRDPENYGVLSFDDSGSVVGIEEKPEKPPSQYALTGLYFYDNTVVEKAKELTFSARGELEISDLNIKYLNDKLLNINIMGRGIAWLDTGTIDSLQEASQYIRTLEHRQGLKIGCPEEVAWRQGWINDQQLEKLAANLLKSSYGEYLTKILELNIKDGI